MCLFCLLGDQNRFLSFLQFDCYCDGVQNAAPALLGPGFEAPSVRAAEAALHGHGLLIRAQ